MTIETRVNVLERRVGDIAAIQQQHTSKIDDVLRAVVDVHNALRELRSEFRQLEDRLPEIIARAVAPLIVGRDA